MLPAVSNSLPPLPAGPAVPPRCTAPLSHSNVPPRLYRPACTAGDALYAMELSLSLEKLNFDKLLQLWQASDNTCCQAV